MKHSRMIWFLFALMGTTAFGQSWSDAYGKALEGIKASQWEAARKAFKDAVALRPEDFSGATMLPGPVTDPRKWRNGSPYSPNFGAAYSAMKLAMSASTDKDRIDGLNTAAMEFETLLDKGQNSKETYYFLSGIYDSLRAVEKQAKLEARIKDLGAKFSWKVDTDVILPEEEAAAVSMVDQIAQSLGQANPNAGNTNPTNSTNPTTTVPSNTVPNTGAFGTKVPIVHSKYALIIGNAESRISDGAIPFAAENAMMLREALVQNGGYAEGNIDVVLNATAANMLSSARALADRLPDDATVLIYFAGFGANLNGKDYLAGVDTELSTDSSTMLSKSELFQLFMAKGARVFSFFEANRPIVSGRYFGMEVPMGGLVSQVQATIPGGSVMGFVKGGKPVGIFANAFTGVLSDFRSNAVPILEFGWQVFYKMRRGNTGFVGGGSTQTPTLPVLTNIAADAKF